MLIIEWFWSYISSEAVSRTRDDTEKSSEGDQRSELYPHKIK